MTAEPTAPTSDARSAALGDLPADGRADSQRDASRSARKRRAILDAAREVFLASGYLGTNMDEIAARSRVSKPTVYKHFGSKEALFVEIVSTMTGDAGDRVLGAVTELADGGDVGAYLRAHAERQLRIVLDPPLLQLRRLVIGEVARFPELATALYDGGPARAIGELAGMIRRLCDRGLLAADDPADAASWFNWLVMSAPLNRAMLLGDGAIPDLAAQRRHAAGAVRIFLAAFGPGAPGSRPSGSTNDGGD